MNNKTIKFNAYCTFNIQYYSYGESSGEFEATIDDNVAQLSTSSINTIRRSIFEQTYIHGREELIQKYECDSREFEEGDEYLQEAIAKLKKVVSENPMVSVNIQFKINTIEYEQLLPEDVEWPIFSPRHNVEIDYNDLGYWDKNIVVERRSSADITVPFAVLNQGSLHRSFKNVCSEVFEQMFNNVLDQEVDMTSLIDRKIASLQSSADWQEDRRLEKEKENQE